MGYTSSYCGSPPLGNGLPVRRRTVLVWLPFVAGLAGCGATPASPTPEGPAPLGARFDPAAAGSVRGRVLWDGPTPDVAPFLAPPAASGLGAFGPRRLWPNPHAPAIDPTTRGVADVVVFLRGVDPARSRPWDHAPAVVELRDHLLFVRQGAHEGINGFVRRGTEVEVVSRTAAFQGVLLRGAAFCALPLPDAGRPWRHRLDRGGVVEVSSGSGQFWMHGWLYVDDHPYYARTAADGSFELPQVPAGRYELVCRAPNWHVAARELDADSFEVSRLTFAAPVERTQTVEVDAGGTAETTFTLSDALFGEPGASATGGKNSGR